VRRANVHVYNSTSTVQRERVFELDRDGVKQIAINGAEMVRRHADRQPEIDWVFQYSPESFTSTEPDYAIEVCEAVMDVWQPTADRPCILNLPATVEVATPNLFADQIEYFSTRIRRRDALVLSIHTHNDRGCAVAAGELALLAGAERVEGTLLGNGERTGNMDIVTMAMNLYSQGVDPELDLRHPDEIIQVYTECTQMPVHPRHPWVGELVYTAFSGSHQDAIRKSLSRQQADEPWQVAYLPVDPEDIGRDYQAVIRVNSQSGKGGVAFVLERDFGLVLPRWLQVEVAQVVQQVSEEQGGEVDGPAIYRLFVDRFVADQVPVRLLGYQLSRNGHDIIGVGAIAAFIDAWSRHSGHKISVVDYAEHAVGGGTDAEAAAYVQINVDGKRSSGAALDRDTVSASLNAVLSALNRAAAGSARAA
jgi:2-isopropylmalate synthase